MEKNTYKILCSSNGNIISSMSMDGGSPGQVIKRIFGKGWKLKRVEASDKLSYYYKAHHTNMDLIIQEL